MGIGSLTWNSAKTIFIPVMENIMELKRRKRMKTFYKISAQEIGTVVIRRRKIAKALRRWLRENGLEYKYNFFVTY